MKVIPNMLFIIDTNIESIAVKEAVKLNIPIVAILDSNSDPTDISYPIPGNDDARRSINLYCEILKETIIDAKKYISKTIVDVSKEKSSDNIAIGKAIKTNNRDKDKEKLKNKENN